MSIKVLIADDHRLIRDSLSDLFAMTDDIDVVAQCSDGDQVPPAVSRTRPDVVLMDLRMPTLDGLQVARELRASRLLARIVLLTSGLTARSAVAARELGLAGYLLKDDDPGGLPDH